MDVISWLFERCPEGFNPQIGFADSKKKALVWLPGNSGITANDVHRIDGISKTAVYCGCTQLAFKSYTESQRDKPCYICHIDFDIDEQPIFDGVLIALGLSVRSSASGSGRHCFLRLDKPILCNHGDAGHIVKLLTKPWVEKIERAGMKVCKADRRLFWLSGGRQEWLHQDDSFYTPPEPLGIGVVEEALDTGRAIATLQEFEKREVPFEPEIAKHLSTFVSLGLLKSVRLGQTPVYVGGFINYLREMGEVIFTKSTCRGNGDVNGYLRVWPNRLELFAFADGHSVWICEA